MMGAVEKLYLTDSVPVLKDAPWSESAEDSLLGALLTDNARYDEVAGILEDRDFYLGANRHIFRAISTLISENKLAEVVSVSQWLKDRDLLEQVGGFKEIADLVEAGTSANIRLYAEIIRDKSILRAVITVSGKMADLAFSANGKTAQTVLSEAQALLQTVDANTMRGEKTFRSAQELLADVFTRMENIKEGEADGVRTGFRGVDAIVNPLLPGQLIVIGARPAVGKTALAVNIAMSASILQKKTVGMFSMEMTDIEIFTRVLSGVSRVPSGKFREARLSDKDNRHVMDAAAKINEMQFFIDDTGGLSIEELSARARLQSRLIGGFGLLIVDYLQLSHARSGSDNRSVELGIVSGGLKKLAKELKCPVIALSQLNRDSTKAQKKPRISELRDSGSIEADADMIFLLHRPYAEDQSLTDQEHDALLIIGKQRGGALGEVPLDYDGRLTRFFDYGKGPFRDGAGGLNGGDYSAQKNGD